MAEKRISWDEDGIAEYDKTRGQKQKIDEPKTPYEYLDEEQLKEEERAEAQRQAEQESVFSGDLAEKLGKEQKKRDFADQRKNHYNEYQMMQELRKQALLEPDSDESESEEEKEKMESQPKQYMKPPSEPKRPRVGPEFQVSIPSGPSQPAGASSENEDKKFMKSANVSKSSRVGPDFQAPIPMFENPRIPDRGKHPRSSDAETEPELEKRSHLD